MLQAVPELGKAFNKLIGSIENVGKTLEEAKQLRWQILRELAKTGKLTSDQILEAMRIIADIEKRETIDWGAVFKRIAEVLGGTIVLVVFGILVVFGLGGRDRDERGGA